MSQGFHILWPTACGIKVSVSTLWSWNKAVNPLGVHTWMRIFIGRRIIMVVRLPWAHDSGGRYLCRELYHKDRSSQEISVPAWKFASEELAPTWCPTPRQHSQGGTACRTEELHIERKNSFRATNSHFRVCKRTCIYESAPPQWGVAGRERKVRPP